VVGIDKEPLEPIVRPIVARPVVDPAAGEIRSSRA
jgi:hypothetical protein